MTYFSNLRSADSDTSRDSPRRVLYCRLMLLWFITKFCKMLKDGILSPRQQQIYEWINGKLGLPVYADIFRGAAVFLKQRPPGYVTFVAHAGRDIMNGLARTVRGDTRKRVEYVHHLNNIAPYWDDRWGASGGFLTTEEPPPHEIPHDVCVKLKALMDDHKRGRDRNEETNLASLSIFLDYHDMKKIPAHFIKEWKDARLWFERHAHVRERPFDPEVNTQLAKHFQMLENFLDIAATSQYGRIRGLDEILDETNG